MSRRRSRLPDRPHILPIMFPRGSPPATPDPGFARMNANFPDDGSRLLIEYPESGVRPADIAATILQARRSLCLRREKADLVARMMREAEGWRPRL